MRISDWSSDVCFSDLRSEGHDMLGPVVPEIATVMTTENGARVAEQSGAFHLANLGPARGAVGGDMALLPGAPERAEDRGGRSEEHTSELQSLMRISYAVFCLIKKKHHYNRTGKPTYTYPPTKVNIISILTHTITNKSSITQKTEQLT